MSRREADLTFEELSAELWALLAPLRRKTANDPHYEWVQLTRVESMDGNTCGLRLYEHRAVGRREVAQFIASATVEEGQDFPSGGSGISYRLEVWRKGHGPKVIWTSSNATERSERVADLVDTFQNTFRRVQELQQNGNIAKNFPEEWTGVSSWTMLPELVRQFRTPLIVVATAGAIIPVTWLLSGGDWLDWRFVLAFALFGIGALLLLPIGTDYRAPDAPHVSPGSLQIHLSQVRRRFKTSMSFLTLAALLITWRLAALLFD